MTSDTLCDPPHMSGLFTWLVDHLVTRHRQRVEVHLRVHTAVLTTPTAEPHLCHFLNVWNASPERSVQITHIWIEAPGGVTVTVVNPMRPLPVVVQPEQQWETFVPVASVPRGTDVEHAARAKLASGEVIESVPRGEDVPPAGMIPG
jgi:hypothetical protein